MTGYFPGANPFAPDPDAGVPLETYTPGEWLRKTFDPSFKPQPYVKPGGIADYADVRSGASSTAVPPPPAAPPSLGVQSGASSTATPPKRSPVDLSAGAYRPEPAWGGVNGLMTRGQMEADLGAHALINARHAQALGGIEDYAKRNDPQREAIEARTKTLVQERLMPEFEGVAGPDGRPVQYEPSLRLNGVEQRQDFAPKGRTVGDIDSIESYIARNPKISAEQDRQRSVQELRGVIGSIQADQSKPPQQREAEIAAAVLKAAQEGALAVGDFQALAKLLGGAGGGFGGEDRP